MPRTNQNEMFIPYILGTWDLAPARIGLSWSEEFYTALLGYLAKGEVQQLVIVHSQAKNARWMSGWLSDLLKESRYSICHWANLDYWHNQRHTAISSLVEERLASLKTIISGSPVVINTTADALMTNTTHRDWFLKTLVMIRVGEDHERSVIEDRLRALGYSQVSRVVEPGSFSFRGALLDVFPAGEKTAYRIEFFADTVSSIKTFATDSQRSSMAVENCVITPFAEFVPPNNLSEQVAQDLYDLMLKSKLTLGERNTILNHLESKRGLPSISRYLQYSEISSSTLTDYLTEPIWFLEEDPSSLVSLAEERYLQEREHLTSSLSEDVINNFMAKRNQFRATTLSHLNGPRTLVISGIAFSRVELPCPVILPKQSLIIKKNSKDLIFELKTKNTLTWFIFCETLPRQERVTKLLAEFNLTPVQTLNMPLDCFSYLGRTGIYLVAGAWPEISSFKAEKEIVFIPSDVLVHERTETKKRSKNKEALDVRSLRAGDYVVHEDFGVGKFLGNIVMQMSNMTSDCLAIEYADGDKIYVPVTSLDRLEKFSESGSLVKLDKLSGLGWFKRKEKARNAARIAAEELLKIQAIRKASKHQVFGEPSDLYKKFCEDFPYKETDDQLQALDEIEADFLSESLMDRLVIGDVGFGKTELAIRASYRTVLEGRQVILICPTTVLSHQHYSTFKARMNSYGIRVAHINRFVKAKDRETIFFQFAVGQIDILIGTHVLLGKKLEASKLGLLIVDEEQKFGVSHKENIKKIRAKSDVLTLTATPIPRTLHMATAGIKDVSILSTPPSNRIAVKNILCHWDSEMIGDAIRSEVNRGGQVFVVHNKIEDIGVIANRLKQTCPDIEFRLGHGRLDAGEIEKIMVDFLDEKYQVLLATSIIESGVDIPNVNTIIINNAHQFGLSQLYQLRGRVGRSNIQAFAYFVVPHESLLTKDAQDRLNAIMGHQELGSGFYVANRDLEIRGAGNMLGAEQSGFVESVGIGLYARLLALEVKKLRGEIQKEEIEPEIKIPVTAFISTDFIADEVDRIKYYRHIFRAADFEVLDDIAEEIIDRFGQPEKEFVNLFLVAKIRILMKKIGAVLITTNSNNEFDVKFGPLDSSQLSRIIDLAHKYPNKLRLLGDFRLTMIGLSGDLNLLISRLRLLVGDE